jgi:DNA repair protein RadC
MTDLFNYDIAEIQVSYSLKVKAKNRPVVTSSKDSYDIFIRFFDNIEYTEKMYAMFLNRANRVLGIRMISSGGIAGTVCDPKNVFQVALKANASSIIICHNHPSGNLQPSEADTTFTRKFKEAGKFLDLPLLDHLIATEDSYFSYADQGLL